MSRKCETYGVREFAAEWNDDLETPEVLTGLDWMTFDDVMDNITRHELVDIFYEFDGEKRKSTEKKMVVTEEEGEEIEAVSNRFNLVQNEEVVGTLSKLLTDFNMMSFTVAEVRDYRDKIVIDVWFDHNSVKFADPALEHTYWTGMEIRAANDATESIQCRGIVCNNKTGSIIRGVTDWEKAKHVKSENVETEDFNDKMYFNFAKTVFELGYYADTMVKNVAEASEITIDFTEETYTLSEFYTAWLPETTPDSVIDGAEQRAYAYAKPEMSMWSVVMGYVSALTHDSSATDGYNNDRSHRIARKALENPEATYDDVRSDIIQEREEPDVDMVERAAETEAEISKLDGTSEEEDELAEIASEFE